MSHTTKHVSMSMTRGGTAFGAAWAVALAAVITACAPANEVTLDRGVQLQVDPSNPGGPSNPGAQPTGLFFLPNQTASVVAATSFALSIEGQVVGGQRASAFRGSVALQRFVGLGCPAGATSGAAVQGAASNGLVTFSGLRVDTAGSYSFRASSGNLTVACHNVVVTASQNNTPATLAFTVVPAPFTVGQAGNVTVEIRNSAGAHVQTATNVVTIEMLSGSCPGSGMAAASSSGAAVGGRRTAALTVNSAGGYALRASSPNLPTICQAVSAQTTGGDNSMQVARVELQGTGVQNSQGSNYALRVIRGTNTVNAPFTVRPLNSSNGQVTANCSISTVLARTGVAVSGSGLSYSVAVQSTTAPGSAVFSVTCTTSSGQASANLTVNVEAYRLSWTGSPPVNSTPIAANPSQLQVEVLDSSNSRVTSETLSAQVLRYPSNNCSGTPVTWGAVQQHSSGLITWTTLAAFPAQTNQVQTFSYQASAPANAPTPLAASGCNVFTIAASNTPTAQVRIRAESTAPAPAGAMPTYTVTLSRPAGGQTQFLYRVDALSGGQVVNNSACTVTSEPAPVVGQFTFSPYGTNASTGSSGMQLVLSVDATAIPTDYLLTVTCGSAQSTLRVTVHAPTAPTVTQVRFRTYPGSETVTGTTSPFSMSFAKVQGNSVSRAVTVEALNGTSPVTNASCSLSSDSPEQVILGPSGMLSTAPSGSFTGQITVSASANAGSYTVRVHCHGQSSALLVMVTPPADSPSVNAVRFENGTLSVSGTLNSQSTWVNKSATGDVTGTVLVRALDAAQTVLSNQNCTVSTPAASTDLRVSAAGTSTGTSGLPVTITVPSTSRDDRGYEVVASCSGVVSRLSVNVVLPRAAINGLEFVDMPATRTAVGVCGGPAHVEARLNGTPTAPGGSSGLSVFVGRVTAQDGVFGVFLDRDCTIGSAGVIEIPRDKTRGTFYYRFLDNNATLIEATLAGGIGRTLRSYPAGSTSGGSPSLPTEPVFTFDSIQLTSNTYLLDGVQNTALVQVTFRNGTSPIAASDSRLPRVEWQATVNGAAVSLTPLDGKGHQLSVYNALGQTGVPGDIVTLEATTTSPSEATLKRVINLEVRPRIGSEF